MKKEKVDDDPADTPDSPALSGVFSDFQISDLIFTFTPDYTRVVRRFLIVFVQICPAQRNIISPINTTLPTRRTVRRNCPASKNNR